MKKPLVSIVIASLNGGYKISTCLNSLNNQTYDSSRIEILVVDDGSIDNTTAVATSFGVKVITLDQNQGRASARNIGWRTSRGEIILFTDDDCVASPSWVERLINQYSPNVMAVGGQIVALKTETLNEHYLQAIGYGNPAPSAFGISKNPIRRFVVYLSSMFNPAVSSGHTSLAQAIFTGNASYRRSILEAINGFDESLITAEDSDLATRARVTFPDELMIFEPAAIVMHSHEPSIWRFAKETYSRAHNTLAFYRKDKKVPPIYPFPILITIIAIAGLILSPWLSLIILLVGPFVFYPWWIIRAIREHTPLALIYGYCQSLYETAEVLGLVVGVLRLNQRLET